MRSRDEINTYLLGLGITQNSIPVEDRAKHPQVIVLHVCNYEFGVTHTTQEFIARIQGRRNMTTDQEKKRAYNDILNYANSIPGEDASTWETNEMRVTLINLQDEALLSRLAGMSVNMLREWVLSGNGPETLYESFENEKGDFGLVDWTHVKESLEEGS